MMRLTSRKSSFGLSWWHFRGGELRRGPREKCLGAFRGRHRVERPLGAVSSAGRRGRPRCWLNLRTITECRAVRFSGLRGAARSPRDEDRAASLRRRSREEPRSAILVREGREASAHRWHCTTTLCGRCFARARPGRGHAGAPHRLGGDAHTRVRGDGVGDALPHGRRSSESSTPRWCGR